MKIKFKHCLFIAILSMFTINLAQASQMNPASTLVSSQTVNKKALDKKTLDTKIKNIRRLYANTNKDINNYQMAEFSTYQSAEGGTTKIYTHDEKLKKVIETFYGETGKRIIEYYFDDNSLYFVFDKDINYNVPITYEEFDESKSRIEENRYYFDRNKMILWLDRDKNSVPRNTKRFYDRQDEVLKPTTFIYFRYLLNLPSHQPW